MGSCSRLISSPERLLVEQVEPGAYVYTWTTNATNREEDDNQQGTRQLTIGTELPKKPYLVPAKMDGSGLSLS